MKSFFERLSPLRLLIYGYSIILLLGFLLLQLPFASRVRVNAIDHLFITTSALSTTGLATIDVGSSYSWFGQFIILILIQIGGLGYMSLGSFVVMSSKRKLTKQNTEMLLSDFSLPQDFSILRFVRSLIFFTIVIELIGAIFLSIIFYQNGVDQFIWNGIFHSISAFCTAGFSLFDSSFVEFQLHFGLNAVISALSIAGALGFIVFTDLYEQSVGRKERITYTSRIILRFTFVGILLGTLILFLTDQNIADMAPERGLLIAFFQSMTAFTTVGFNSYDISIISSAPLFIMVLLMIIGASPSGTGGGMKSTTFTALFAHLKCTFRGDNKAIYMGRTIPPGRVAMATSNFFFYVMVVCIGTFLLLLVEAHQTFEVLFEAVSALGTVGLSLGITGTLSPLGKIFIMVLMFLGRIGPLSFGMAIFSPDEQDGDHDKMEDLAI